jgi:hypothetical protein
MATRKKDLSIAKDLQPTQIEEVIKVTQKDFMMIGKDADLTDMIYGKPTKAQVFKSDILPEATDEIGGVTNDLQLFINTYQPGELISRRMFRELLLRCLNDWKDNG